MSNFKHQPFKKSEFYKLYEELKKNENADKGNQKTIENKPQLKEKALTALG